MTAHIQIVGWNHQRRLEVCLRSCLGQTVRVPVLYVDNASTDGSADLARRLFPDVRVLKNRENRGYAGGHNDGLCTIEDTEVAILLNPDVVLEPTFVEEILKPFADRKVGAVAPLLFRDKRQETRSTGMDHTRVVDSYGTRLLPSLRAVNQYEGESVILDSGFVLREPWGFSGAAVALRRSALKDISLGQIFDEDLFAYREDVDLSWRLRHRGWKIVGEPRARATHVRTARAGEGKSPRVVQLSWRNYFLVLLKNVPAAMLITHAIPIVLEGLARKVQLLVTPSLWPMERDLFRLTPRFLQKRSAVLARRR
jgi:GT2 family glycosyltransferase